MQLNQVKQMLIHDIVDGIREICQPLISATPINCYQFIRFYNDWSRVQIGTNPDWIESFFSRKLYLRAKLFKNQEDYQNGFYLRDHWLLNCSYYVSASKIAADEFDLAHGLSIVKRNDQYFDMFEMSVPKDYSNSDEFYHSNIDLLEKFSDYFFQKANKIITQAEQNKFLVEYPENFDIYHVCEDHEKALIDKNKMQELPQLKLYLKLSKREKQIINWLFHGKTMAETAMILGISPKTLEKYIPQIKAKLNCRSLFQLGAMLAPIQQRIMLEEITC